MSAIRPPDAVIYRCTNGHVYLGFGAEGQACPHGEGSAPLVVHPTQKPTWR